MVCRLGILLSINEHRNYVGLNYTQKARLIVKKISVSYKYLEAMSNVDLLFWRGMNRPLELACGEIIEPCR